MGRAALIHRAGSRWREKTRNKRGRCRPQRGKRSAGENRFDDRVMRRLEKWERQAVICRAVIWMNKAFTHAYAHEGDGRIERDVRDVFCSPCTYSLINMQTNTFASNECDIS